MELDDETLENWVWGEGPQLNFVAFWIATSTGVVYLVTETGKWALLEPGRTLKAETWSRGIFFQFVMNGVVYFWMVPSIGVVCLVAEMQKRVPTELEST